MNIRNLIEKNIKILKDIEKWIESDLAKPFQTKITFSQGIGGIRTKGIFFPSVDNLVNAMAEREEMYTFCERVKEEARKTLKLKERTLTVEEEKL